MLTKRLGGIALAAVLAACLVPVGTRDSSAIEASNGTHGPYRIIKDYVLASFEYGLWAVQKPKEGTVEHKCEANGGSCYFAVAYEFFFGNCTTSASDPGASAECRVGGEQAYGPSVPEGGQLFRCEDKSIVRTISNMLFVPDTCVDEDDE